MATTNPTGWWMYHGDPEHSGVVSGSPITSKNVATLKVLHDLHLGGPVLSVPAVTNGYVYVGLANSASSPGNNGGLLCKINLATGKTDASFRWDIDPDERDSHGFTGMGCTPAVVDGKVIFSSFNGVIYCLNEADMTLLWATNLRYPDPAQNQWADNFTNGTSGAPLAEGWSSPLVVNGKVYVGFGEGENPQLFGWVYCLDENTGKVVWLYCTVPFNPGTPNPPNVIPPAAAFAVNGPAPANPPPPFSVAPQNPPPVGGASWAGGCSVWSGIAYDADLKRIYATTGNPQPDSALPSPPNSNGLLSLDADTGEYKGFFQALPESSYRVSDIDVDVGGSPIIFTRPDGVKVVGFGCKNGGFFLIDADTMNLIAWCTLLPYVDITNGKVSAQLQIPSIDPHVPGSNVQINPHVSNAMSNVTPAENFMGTYSTPAVDPASQRIFIGVGGKNYDTVSPGIDFATTPFLRALDWNTLKDVWPTAATPISDDVRAMLDGEIPDGYTATLTKYTSCAPPMYTNPGEAALSSPAVVNDVVFCSTSNVSIYAFNTADGTPLWSDDLGSQTDGFTGGYGYCLGPAIYENYVVAGALVAGGDGGVLRIYQLA